jgi:3-oxoacyl-(acyl-carrier-protein) synthase
MSLSSQSIVISGLGVISACGNNIQETLNTFSLGKRNSCPVSLFSTSLTCPVFEVKGLNLTNNNPELMRTFSLCLIAVTQAIEDSGLITPINNLRVGVCLGTTVASQLNDTDFYREYKRAGNADMHSVNRYLKNNLAQGICEKFNFSGPASVVVNACSSGTDALGVGLSWLRENLCDIVICGGADELNRVPLAGFNALGVVSADLCMPFDKNRSGLNLGEGAGVVVIEKEDVCRKRGKKSKFFLRGYGLACDAYHLTAPRPDGRGLETALVQAMKQAQIKPCQVSFINAHGTATKDNDKVEGMVLTRVFDKKIKFLSTKGFTGHTLGAAGGLEAVFTVLGLDQGWIPASPGFTDIDEEIAIAPVNQKTEITGNYAISTSLAFGGNNSAIVIEKR